MTKSELLRADFERATTRLEEALALAKDAIVEIPQFNDLKFRSSCAGNSSRHTSKRNTMYRVHLREPASALPSKTE
jgi:hypothetical protein